MKYLLNGIFVFIVIICTVGSLRAQQSPAYSQSYFNPSLYNPSYFGANDRMELFLTHRRQWVGIEDAPTVSNLDFHYSVAPKLSLGLTAASGTSVLLTSSRILGNVVYHLDLGKGQRFNFGISAGINGNRLDLGDAVPLDDPALLEATGRSTFIDGRFGINYHYKGFDLGFALPKLFRTKVNTTTAFGSPEIDALEEKIVALSYRSPQGEDSGLSFQPFLLYRAGGDARRQLEVSLLTYFKDVLWAGASFRKGDGIAALFGTKVKDRYRIAYAYEFGALASKGVPSGTHEIQVHVIIGKHHRPERSLKERKDDALIPDRYLEDLEAEEAADMDLYQESDENPIVDEPSLPTDEEAQEIQSASSKREKKRKRNESGKRKKDKRTKEKRTSSKNETDAEHQSVSDDFEFSEGNQADDGILSDDSTKKKDTKAEDNSKRWSGFNDRGRNRAAPAEIDRYRTFEHRGSLKIDPSGIPYLRMGFYIVVGAFDKLENAQKYAGRMKEAGYDVSVGTKEETGMYYLYTYDSGSEKEARERIRKVRKRNGFQFAMAWLLIIGN